MPSAAPSIISRLVDQAPLMSDALRADLAALLRPATSSVVAR